MDRCIVLVDAGYLLGAAASLLAGEPSRSRITVDHAALIQGLRDRAENDTRRPLLRLYWFDGAPDRVPQPEHRRLRVMPRVTVRLGALTRSDGRWAQKGVDAAMHAELTELARNRACSDIVLVTGDGDLLPGMMAAKEHGVAVHLWAVQAADGDYNQSEDLVAEADERRVLDRAWITQAVRAKETGGVCAPPPAPRPEIAAILSAPLPESGLSSTRERPAEEGEHGPAPAAAARAESGSGAERIAAISGRGTGGGAHTPVTSFARTAWVIQARSSTRRSSASATRSSDWLKSPSAACTAHRWTATPCSLAAIMPGSRSPSPVTRTTSEQARLRASSVSSACIAASTPFCAQRPSLRVRAPSRTVTRGITRSLRCSGCGTRSGAPSNQ